MDHILQLSGPEDVEQRSLESPVDSHEGAITGNAETREDADMTYL